MASIAASWTLGERSVNNGWQSGHEEPNITNLGEVATTVTSLQTYYVAPNSHELDPNQQL
ncbi:hypothetical protein HYDPIDRAFT_115031 [Hydnomerulius pinastri MD-312]|uniref:Uncharacterized protein n=1 Tax=Hydnomerulius pinastri MD-312 TaxID=994086 RepID=A0A0C9WCI6_9AGAM|nr:hypothetical protein HYDPIDRAFT_115031 [Hydnomerulius pinastri MD-312]